MIKHKFHYFYPTQNLLKKKRSEICLRPVKNLTENRAKTGFNSF